ncbi:MAG: effector binding domain-containing protein [Tepidanaerobacteraceae bacterium]|jgi:AraC family transcriptional regulator|nr:effector binding domain-containing protein [Tepidanaerobacteraceae bacterium]
MVKVRIEEKRSFSVVGKKTRISGQNNEEFGSFWKESHENGLIKKLHDMNQNQPGEITNSNVFGISCVEKDPNNRAFYFFIATESDKANSDSGLESYIVPASKWAIFEGYGELPMSLIEAEMYAFMEWLPSSTYNHALAPELEVYPSIDQKAVEFWLPIIEK